MAAELGQKLTWGVTASIRARLRATSKWRRRASSRQLRSADGSAARISSQAPGRRLLHVPTGGVGALAEEERPGVMRVAGKSEQCPRMRGKGAVVAVEGGQQEVGGEVGVTAVLGRADKIEMLRALRSRVRNCRRCTPISRPLAAVRAGPRCSRAVLNGRCW